MAEDFESGVIRLIDDEMNNIVDEIFQLSQENLVNPHIKQFNSGKTKQIITTDRGFLLKSGNVRRKLLDKEVIYSAPYADDVELGATTAHVDEKTLERWVKRKVLKNKGSKQQVQRLAKSIARSLEKRGQSPDPYLRPAIEAVQAKR